MNETIQEINKTFSIFESDKLHSELRILDWIFYQVFKDQQRNWIAIYFTSNPTSHELTF